MFFWSTIVVGFSLCVLGELQGNGEYQKEVDELKQFNVGMTQFSGLEGLLIETESYVNAVREIDEQWPIMFFTGMDESRVQYSVELIKVREFVERFQCSQAALALAYTQFLTRSVRSMGQEQGETKEIKPQLVNVSNAVDTIIPKMLAALHSFEMTLPKWMVMVNLFAYDLYEKASEDEERFKNAINNYLLNSANRIVDELTAYTESCRDFLQDTGTSTIIVSSTDYEDIVKKLTALADSMEKAATQNPKLLDDTLFESFHLKQWLLKEMVKDSRSLVAFMPETINVSWHVLRHRIISRLIGLNDYSAENENWILKMFESYINTQNSAQFLLKNVYRISVLRHVLIVVTYCDNMNAQIKQSSNLLIKDTYTSGWQIMCEPIIRVVADAVEYLGEDEFLDKLLPLLEIFVNNDGLETSNIIAKVGWMLNNLSGKLDIDANNYIAPLEYKSLNDNKGTPPEETFKEVKNAVENALLYTDKIKDILPHLSFKVIDAIINSVKGILFNTNPL